MHVSEFYSIFLFLSSLAFLSILTADVRLSSCIRYIWLQCRLIFGYLVMGMHLIFVRFQFTSYLFEVFRLFDFAIESMPNPLTDIYLHNLWNDRQEEMPIFIYQKSGILHSPLYVLFKYSVNMCGYFCKSRLKKIADNLPQYGGNGKPMWFRITMQFVGEISQIE